jgi:dipeptidyl aminopeptidase/acylaminoacyl peptidase
MRLIAGCLAVFSVATALAAPPVPLATFVRVAEFESAKISPGGEYLAVTMPIEGHTTLGIIDLRTRKVTGHLRWDEDQVYDYWWTGPDRVVASIAIQMGPLDQPRLTGELYGMNADGSKRRYIFGARGAMGTTFARSEPVAEWAWASVVDPLPHEPNFALIAIDSFYAGLERPVVERINVYNGNRTKVAVVPGAYPIDVATDRVGNVRFAYGSERGGRKHLYVKDAGPVGWTEVTVPGAGVLDAVELHEMTADGDTVYLTTSSGVRSCLRTYRISAATFSELRCSERGLPGYPMLSSDGTTLIGLIHDAGLPEAEYLENSHPDVKLRKGLEKGFPGQRVVVTSRTLDGRKLVVLTHSGRNPGDYYIVDRDTKKAEYLFSRRSWIDPAAMSEVSAISYRTRDGATVHGFLTAAEGLKTRGAPLVVMPHGGPHGIRDWWQWDEWPQALASRGYAVLQPNFRGSGGYGNEHERAGHRKWGTLMQDDLTDAVRWAIAAGVADPKRVCIMGASYGGYAALMSSVREPDLYRCAIGFAGVYELTSQTDDLAYSYLGRSYMQRVFGDDALMIEQSPLTYVESLKVPVLIAHGTADSVVPFIQAKKLRSAMERHNKKFEWLEYKDEEHGFHVEKNHEDFLKRSIEFLDKHIGPQSQAANAPGR